MQRAVAIVVAVSLGCVTTQRVVIIPGDSEGDRCLATCKTRPNTDEVVACAAMCPGARADHGFCERRIDDEGEPGELFPGCVESTHVNVRRIAWIAGGVAIGVVVVLALGALAFASAPTH